MGWLRCFTNRSICRSLADHSCLRHSSFDPVSAIAHSRNTVSSHEPETPGLRELAASIETGGESLPEWILLRVSFFFRLDACHLGTAMAAHLVGFLGAAYNFLEHVPQRHLRSLEGIAACLSHLAYPPS